ncbi:hypothetical protein IAT40_007251 [Kwoniella sp. CBS 6097]
MVSNVFTVIALLIVGFGNLVLVLADIRLGCYLWPNVTNGESGDDVGPFSGGDDDCRAVCVAQRHNYMYESHNWGGDVGYYHLCLCLDTSPDPELEIPDWYCDWAYNFDGNRTVTFIESGPSAFVKRAIGNEGYRQETQNKNTFCPSGLTACNVPHPDGISYECIDTSSEIESCGGCLYGQFKGYEYSFSVERHDDHDQLEVKQGTDCTTILGVRQNSVTCEQGRCVAYGCEEGYHIEGGRCVPSQGTQS